MHMQRGKKGSYRTNATTRTFDYSMTLLFSLNMTTRCMHKFAHIILRLVYAILFCERRSSRTTRLLRIVVLSHHSFFTLLFHYLLSAICFVHFHLNTTISSFLVSAAHPLPAHCHHSFVEQVHTTQTNFNGR